MGNQLRKEYEIEDEPCGSGGFGLHWKIYNGTHIKTKQEVSIFILNKKSLPIRKNQYYDLFRRDISVAQQCKHSDILKIIRPNDSSKSSKKLLESSSQLAFVSERIIGSLADFINSDLAINDTQKRQLKLGELRIKLGITQLVSAVEYVHSNGGSHPFIHGFIDLCNVYVSQTGDWKLMGFSFTHPITHNGINGNDVPDWTLGSYKSEKNLPFLPKYTCLAPEIYTKCKIDTKSDVFSVCRVIYFVYLYFTQKMSDFPGCFLPTMSDYQMFLKSNTDTAFIADEQISHILDIGLVRDINARCEFAQLINSPIAKNVNVKVIRYLDELECKTTEKKIGFINKLSGAAATFSYDIIIDKLVPSLCKELRVSDMQTHVLPLIFQLLYIKVESSHFQTIVFPALVPFFQLRASDKAFQIIAKHIGIITKYANPHQTQKILSHFYGKCLKIRFNISIQKIVLTELANAIRNDLFGVNVLKNLILPSLSDICKESAYNDQITVLTSLRVNVLMCFSKIFDKFSEKDIIHYIITPIKHLLLISQQSTAILMSILGVFQAFVKDNTHRFVNIIGAHLIPTMTPIYLNPNLKPKQYKFCIKLIRQMLDYLEAFKSDSNPSQMKGGLPSPVMDSNFSHAHQVPHHEIDIIAVENANKTPELIIEDQKSITTNNEEREITPFPQEHNVFFPDVLNSPLSANEIITANKSRNQSRNQSTTFSAINYSTTVPNQIITIGDDDTKHNPFFHDVTEDITITATANDVNINGKDWMNFGLSNEETKTEMNKNNTNLSANDNGNGNGHSDWNGFGHFSIDSVDIGKLGKGLSENQIIKEEVRNDINPFENDSESGNEVLNDDNNPFADTNVRSEKSNAIKQSTTFDDPFQGLFD